MLSTKDKIETTGNFSAASSIDVYEAARYSALARIKKLIGSEFYAEVLVASEHTARNAVVEAENCLVVMYYLPVKNISSQSDGIEKQSSQHDGTTTYLSQQEIDDLQNKYWQMAIMILDEYLVEFTGDLLGKANEMDADDLELLDVS